MMMMADGWDGRPYPDNTAADKYKLCVNGIEKAHKSMAPGMPNCYIWIDYGCLNQEGNPSEELNQLDEIMRNADAFSLQSLASPPPGQQLSPTAISIQNINRTIGMLTNLGM
jgi:hypothetical protein